MESTRKTLPPNPRESSNIFSILSFTWTLPLFKKGYSKILELDDIFQPLNVDRSESLGDRLEKTWEKQLAKSKHPSLMVAIFATFWKEIVIYGCICFFNEIIARLEQPLLLGMLLKYFRTDTSMTYEDALYYSCGLLIVNALLALSSSQFYMAGFHNGMKIRVAVCSLIYRKSLRLSQTALGETSPGKVVNLLSNDVSRFEWVTILFHTMWTSPLLTLIIAILLWTEIGYAGLIGIGVIFVVVPIQSYTMKMTSKFRAQTALRTDQRIRFMDEITAGVQVIKMYAWEAPFSQLVKIARRLELKIIRKTSYVRGLYMTFVLFTTRMAVFCTMLAIVLIYGSHEITADRVFVISSYFTIISLTMNQMFVRGIAEIAEALVALKRLQKFLNLEEKQTESIAENANGDSNTANTNGFAKNGHAGNDGTEVQVKLENFLPPNIAVSMKDATAIWDKPPNENQTSKDKTDDGVETYRVKHESMIFEAPTLDNLNIEIPKGKLIGVIGPVGAGKSSLLQVLLRELPLKSGSIHINGTTSYANQEPWVFAASVRQNILFGEEFDHDRYNSVVKCCALQRDFEQFENGDLSIVGEKGSLSGGQKARINLARACYRNADVYLLDDPLSAVDAHVGTHIFNRCVGPKGYLARSHKTRILVTHQVHFLKEADWLIVLNDGKVEVQGSPTDLSKSGVDFAKLVGLKEETEERKDAKLSRQSSIASVTSTNTSISDFDEFENGNDDKDQGLQMEESSKGKVKGSVSMSYFTAGAHPFVLILLAFLFVIVQILASGTDYWVSIWIKQEKMRAVQELNTFDSNGDNNTNSPMSETSENASFTLTTEQCIYINAALVAGIFILGITRSLGFYQTCMNASQNIYSFMFNGIISTKMRFFDTNPSGRILNRFSKDIGTIDEQLPKAILDGVQSILILTGSIVVTAIVNPYFLIPFICLGSVFLYIRKVYLKTSKNIKRIEGIAKSPAFTHLAATLSGLATVRSFNAEALLRKEFDHHQDTHSACWFMFAATSSAFGFSLDVLCWIFVSCIVFFYSYSFLDVNIKSYKRFSVRQSAEIVNLMTSVERALEYRDLEPEIEPEKPQEVADNWPTEGSIEFRNVIYRYFNGADPVLRNLSLLIKPKEKIGIVGRTGAGKSSLIGAIFRLACIEGKILIDWNLECLRTS